MFKLRPITLRRLNRFLAMKRGWYSFLILSGFTLFSIFAALFIGSRALIVKTEHGLRFPVYGEPIPGKAFGLPYRHETDYKQLKSEIDKTGKGFVLMPIIPWGPNDMDYDSSTDFPPLKPSSRHWLGTDSLGRDILARLVYGFRESMKFALLVVVLSYIIGIVIGCLSGYFGRWIDMLTQRLQEIWSSMPVLFLIIIISSMWSPGLFGLAFINAAFGWMGLATTMRALTFKEKQREYVAAARALGAGTGRIIFVHILPNTLSVMISYLPFMIAGGISALTALDFLGYGLQPPTPSWGDLMDQGLENLESPWILSSVVVSLFLVLTLIAFIGEAVREAYDPKRHSTYE